jgi:glucose/arabinose dehydrogenase/cytochrome c5
MTRRRFVNAFIPVLCAAAGTLCSPPAGAAEPTAPAHCAGDNGGLTLSAGFCATVFADNLGHVRHMVVSPANVLYVNTWSGSYYPASPAPPGGFLIALQDTHDTGKADVIRRFGATPASGGAGGTGIALYHDALYAEAKNRILRYPLKADEVVPTGAPQVVVSGLPNTGDHPMHPFIIDAQGNLFMDSASATNACELVNRMPLTRGHSPCTEKKTRAGTWRYDANKTNQKFSAANRYATGIRNGEGFAIDENGRLYVTQHGRDMLSQNWQNLYTALQGAELPAEEIVELHQGADYGWPECYFDGSQKKLVLAPEYGGDGGNKVGLCTKRSAPAAFFPGHWAPDDLLIVNGANFPDVYRHGWFVAFHGSWNRAPAPQGGYDVVFQPMRDGKAEGDFIVFADGFAGAVKEPGRADHRPAGLAIGPDGALYISDDIHGRIWRVTYQGGPKAALSSAPAPEVQAKTAAAASAQVADLPLPNGVSREQLILGARIFLGQERDGTCGGCHGGDAKGTPVGPDLTAGTWSWSDGSSAGIASTIGTGVPRPKKYPGAMPPKGGAPLSDSDVQAVAAYVWAMGHR